LLVAREVISLAEFGEHERGVGRLALRAEGFGCAPEMFGGGRVLPVPEIDVAERVGSGGEAALVVCLCEEPERGFE
jgi:hypothetical protein